MRLNGLKQIWDWTNLGLNKIEIVQLELGSAYLEMWKDIINNDIINNDIINNDIIINDIINNDIIINDIINNDIINNDIIIKESFIEQSFIILLSYYYMSIKSLA